MSPRYILIECGAAAIGVWAALWGYDSGWPTVAAAAVLGWQLLLLALLDLRHLWLPRLLVGWLALLRAGRVPRHGVDGRGRALRHFSWVTLERGAPGETCGVVRHVSHRWYGLGGDLLYAETLWQAPSPVLASRC